MFSVLLLSDQRLGAMICRSVVNVVILLAELSLAHYHYQDYYRKNEAREYPTGYEPDEKDEGPDRITFDAIYDRRKNFDVETPMGLQSGASSEADQQVYDRPPPRTDADHYHQHDMQSSDPNRSPADDYAPDAPMTADPNSKQSLLSDGCLRCLCEVSLE